MTFHDLVVTFKKFSQLSLFSGISWLIVIQQTQFLVTAKMQAVPVVY